MAIRIDKKLLWLKRYITLLKKKEWINLNRISAIRAYKLPMTKMEDALAGCLRCNTTGRYTITLRMATHTQLVHHVQLKTTRKRIVKNVGYEDIPYREILHDLAHEIAHTVAWKEDHSVTHEILTIKIYSAFLHQLRIDIANGVIDEADA